MHFCPGVGRESFREMDGHPVALAVLGDIVFWTQFASNRLFWTAKSDMERRVIKKVTMGKETLITPNITYSQVNKYCLN